MFISYESFFPLLVLNKTMTTEERKKILELGKCDFSLIQVMWWKRNLFTCFQWGRPSTDTSPHLLYISVLFVLFPL